MRQRHAATLIFAAIARTTMTVIVEFPRTGGDPP
jgi:hypothetical protein